MIFWSSCLTADTAGSTGRDPVLLSEGANDGDLKCLVEHNPAFGKYMERMGNQPPSVSKQNTTFVSSILIGLNTLWRPLVQYTGSTETGKFTGTCKPNILIFAKGTFEPFELGITIGPSFTSGLAEEGWTVHGVPYTPDVPGDFCLGLPGGMVAKDVIDQAAEKCPNSRIFVSGYSQEAMVIRNGLARATPSARQKVKGLITFGDPFNGSPVKAYNGPIAIYCNDGDNVCTGNFELRAAHLSYGIDSTACQAQRKLRELAGESCCQLPANPKPPTPQEWAQTIKANGGKIPIAAPGITLDQWADAVSSSHGTIPKYTAKSARMDSPPNSNAPLLARKLEMM